MNCTVGIEVGVTVGIEGIDDGVPLVIKMIAVDTCVGNDDRVIIVDADGDTRDMKGL